ILAVEIMVSDDRINRDERVLVFNTGSATKYVETVSLDLPVIADPDKFDYESIA
ncbi:MAG: threonine synthase, partial [Planctomycetes bacterium]|nr:threonine synthase [Planctomycetota bacterium]